jgi:hypothetical protein
MPSLCPGKNIYRQDSAWPLFTYSVRTPYPFRPMQGMPVKWILFLYCSIFYSSCFQQCNRRVVHPSRSGHNLSSPILRLPWQREMLKPLEHMDPVDRLNRLYINHKMVKICAQEGTYLRTCLIRTEEDPKVIYFLPASSNPFLSFST